MSSIGLFRHAKRNVWHTRPHSVPAKEDRPFLMHGDSSNLQAALDEATPGQSQLKAAKNLISTPAQAELRAKTIKLNSDHFAVQGMLVKYAQRGPLGLLGEVMHARWFKLNPANATLSYWVPGCCCGAPRRAYRLQQLEEVDTNHFHNRIFLKFQGRPLLRLKASNAEEFERWMHMINLYVQPPAETLDTADVHLDLNVKADNSAQLIQQLFPQLQRDIVADTDPQAASEVRVNAAEAKKDASKQEEVTKRLNKLGYTLRQEAPACKEAGYDTSSHWYPGLGEAKATAGKRSASAFTFSKKHAEDQNTARRRDDSKSVVAQVKSYVKTSKRGGC